MYHKYIVTTGLHSINIDHQARKIVEDNLKKPHCNMFDVAEKQVHFLVASV